MIKRSSKLFILAFFALSTVVPAASPSPVSAANSCSDVYAPISSSIINSVNNNKHFYLAATAATGVPWELLAAIHYRETSFSRSNPGNGQGIFQFVNGDGGPYPPGPVSDANFQQQLNYMASRIQSDYVYRGSLAYTHRPLQPNEPDDFRVQDTLYSYNGRSQQYAEQGAVYGFNPATQPYQGSPYVMNMFDCARANMGIVTKDYGTIDSTDPRYGAFTLYSRLKGDGYWQSRYDFLGTNTRLSLPGCTEATNTSLLCVWRTKQLGTDTPALATTDAKRDRLVTYGYRLDGKAFFGHSPSAPRAGNIPVYELGLSGKAFFTADQNERNALLSSGNYTNEGIAFYADPAGSNSGYPVYRLYKSGTHIWASNSAEVESLKSQGYQVEGESFASISPVRQEEAAPAGKSLVYRFYIPASNSHLWTTDLSERDNLINSGYPYERVAWHSTKDTSQAPVYRLYAPSLKRHLYTADANERNVLTRSGGWNYEGVSYYVSKTATSSPVYRLYAPSIAIHLLTADAHEADTLSASGNWINEGVAWYQP